jgi:hypothetical protein
MAELLFAHGMDPDHLTWMRRTPLHHFASNGDIEAASIYIDHGANLEAQDGERLSTPLAMAAEAGHTRMVEFLLRSGARVDPVDGPAWAKPIAWAERRGHTAIVKILRDYAKTATLPTRTVAGFEQLANDVVRAYGGDAESLNRIAEHLRAERQLRWDNPSIDEQIARFRRVIRAQLGDESDAISDELSPTDARTLVARWEGFGSWTDLVTDVSR